MKALHTMRFWSDAIETLTEYKASVRAAETYEEAKQIANRMIGYLDCLVTFTNTMICKENNGLTPELDDVINDWHAGVFQLLVDKATETHQDHETVWKLLRRRDEIAG